MAGQGVPLRGIVPPMVTPLAGTDELDAGGLERLVEHLVTGGVHGIFVLGTTGEGPSLSGRLKRELVSRTAALAAGRVPVVVGVTDASFVESVRLAEHCREAGAEAVVLAAPYYFPAGHPEVLEYLRHLCPELPLPVLLYNMPATTKIALEPETVFAAAEIENVVGYKDSSGDAAHFGALLDRFRGRRDFALFMGAETLIGRAVTEGAAGGIPGGGNVHPRLFARIYEAALGGDAAGLARLQAELESFQRIYRHGQHWSSMIKGVKCSLSLMGICDDFAGEGDLRDLGLFEEYGRA